MSEHANDTQPDPADVTDPVRAGGDTSALTDAELFDPLDADHPVGQEQAAENEATESPA